MAVSTPRSPSSSGSSSSPGNIPIQRHPWQRTGRPWPPSLPYARGALRDTFHQSHPKSRRGNRHQQSAPYPAPVVFFCVCVVIPLPEAGRERYVSHATGNERCVLAHLSSFGASRNSPETGQRSWTVSVVCDPAKQDARAGSQRFERSPDGGARLSAMRVRGRPHGDASPSHSPI